MPTSIDRDQVQRLLAEQDAQLVEALPAAEYEDEHLPRATNVPLKELDRQTATRLENGRPVIVYCYDFAVRHEPASRVAAREHRLRAGVRLRRLPGAVPFGGGWEGDGVGVHGLGTFGPS
jgi:rhodanese-related sulfurtransferase